jgi:hypothetical protein
MAAILDHPGPNLAHLLTFLPKAGLYTVFQAMHLAISHHLGSHKEGSHIKDFLKKVIGLILFKGAFWGFLALLALFAPSLGP